MALWLDHLIVFVHDLDRATADYAALGFTVTPGGRHASGSTHNALVIFRDGTYVELIAPTGDAPQPTGPDYLPLLGEAEGLAGFCLTSDDLAADVADMHARGIPIGAPIPGGRTRPDGTALEWLGAMLPDHPLLPLFHQDVTPRDLRVPVSDATAAHANGASGIRGLTLFVPELEAEAARYAHLLDQTLPSGDIGRTLHLGNVRLLLRMAFSPTPPLVDLGLEPGAAARTVEATGIHLRLA